MFAAAGGLVTFVVELFPFPANVEPPLVVAGVDLFQSVAATPSPATRTNRIIKNGKYRFIELRMHRHARHLAAVAAFRRGHDAQRLGPIDRGN